MSDGRHFDDGLTPAERDQLRRMGERLEHERPVPRAAFRGDLRRALVGGRSKAVAGRWRILVATYSGLGTLLLAVAALGLAGAGPFAA